MAGPEAWADGAQEGPQGAQTKEGPLYTAKEVAVRCSRMGVHHRNLGHTRRTVCALLGLEFFELAVEADQVAGAQVGVHI